MLPIQKYAWIVVVACTLLPACTMAQSGRIVPTQLPVGHVNRDSRRYVMADRVAAPSIGTAHSPDFFFANALNCSDVMLPGQMCDLRFERFRPNGRIYPVSERELHDSLKPGVPVCVIVHGSFVPQNEVTAFVRAYQWVRNGAPDLPLHVVFYRWPSAANFRLLLPQLQIEQLGQRAEHHGLRLADFLQRIPLNNPVGILAHSHGTRCASSALHLLGGGRIGGIGLRSVKNRRLYRVVFGAAAIDHHWLNPNERFGRSLISTEYILNLRTRRDWALDLYSYRAPFSQPALGMAGLSQFDRSLLGPLFAKYREIDVTSIVGLGHSERAYYPHVVISKSFAPWLYYVDRVSIATKPEHPRKQSHSVD
jgi:hypothetical protein